MAAIVIVLHFADDLGQNLAYGDAAHGGFLDRVDQFVEQNGLSVPAEPEARARRGDPPCVTEPLRQLDRGVIGLGAVIWATGYTFDFGWIDLPVLAPDGRPKHNRGIAPVGGMYFLGLPWLSKMSSSFLSGVGDDAARLADCIARGEAGINGDRH
jgi:putative flavoprotein involved in K+ transport